MKQVKTQSRSELLKPHLRTCLSSKRRVRRSSRRSNAPPSLLNGYEGQPAAIGAYAMGTTQDGPRKFPNVARLGPARRWCHENLEAKGMERPRTQETFSDAPPAARRGGNCRGSSPASRLSQADGARNGVAAEKMTRRNLMFYWKTLETPDLAIPTSL